jgi:hypothetical protein
MQTLGQNSKHMRVKARGVNSYHCGLNLHKLVLSYVLYGCQTWYLTLRKENGLQIPEKKVDI